MFLHYNVWHVAICCCLLLIKLMRSTKVQTLGAYCMSCSSTAYYVNARARKLATPRVVAVTRGVVSSRSNAG